MSTQVMPNWLSKRADLTPHRLAIVFGEETLTFADLYHRATLIAKRLSSIGVKEGDHVALLLQNGLPMVELIHALQYLGAVLVPLNIRLTSREISWQINDSKTSLLIYDERHQAIVSELPNQVVKLDYMQIDSLSVANTNLNHSIHLDAPHTLMYTSGTTGKPKGVILSYGNHWWSAIGSSLNLGLHTNDRWLCCVPLFHMSGLSILLRSVIYGITAVLHESFDPTEVNETIKEARITIVSVVSVMLSHMIDDLDPLGYPDTLRCMLLGGGPAPQSLLEKCKAIDIPVFQTFGMTETASQLATLSPEYMLPKLGSAGKPLFPSELTIRIDGEIMPANQAGEIVVRGPNVTQGYWNREDATTQAIKEGWFYTGDIGYLDEDGFLYVLDRRKDLIISGGENVYPAEIESVILELLQVEDVGVAGIPHEKWGQVPIAFIVLKEDKHIRESEIIDYCSKKLAKYKVPAHIHFVDELPRNASKKLQRHKLQQLMDM